MLSSMGSPSLPPLRSSRSLARVLLAVVALLLAPAAAADEPLRLELIAPASGDYGAAVELRGTIAPALPGARVTLYRGDTYVTTAVGGVDGRWSARIRLAAPGTYEARLGVIRSAAATVAVRPRLVLELAPVAALGSRLVLSARLEPPSAGTLDVRVRSGDDEIAQRGGGGALRLVLPTVRAGVLEATADSTPAPGWEPVSTTASSTVVVATLAPGARGDSVRVLERLLASQRYLLRRVDDRYEDDTREAVLAFQKLNGLPRTGAVTTALWRSLATAGPVAPRFPVGDHIEVDKRRQVLLTVEAGRVTQILHVSTGATGNTPLGTWRVYRKLPGMSGVLWYPMFFLRGFAIHGYPSVPAYPASHGCVRVPMWAAPQLFSRFGLGATIRIHL